ncbi:zinc-binding dehydrogenase [Puia sp. P3]|uniref:zinc-binding dehydrogenase n=1 Tax=Puia sp. P3 TaxID=3423952 RepID=UPI003D67DE0D
MDGRLVYISSMRGKDAQIDIRQIMEKRLTITGSMLKPRDAAYKARLAADIEAQVWPLIAKGAMKPLIYKTFPLEQAAEAQQLMESSEHLGKILLRVS